jgi:FkbM family methyltransferase
MIKKFISGLYLKFFFRRKEFRSYSINGKSVDVIPGTFRVNVDLDDLWIDFFSKHYDSFFDVGCNIGLTALKFKIAKPLAKLLLVDPNGEALEYAFRNLLKNNLSYNVDFFEGFVSDSDNSVLDFYTVGVGAAGSFDPSNATTASMVGSSFAVKTVTLDSLCNYVGWFPEFIKIDVEGAEVSVLKGASQIASAGKTVFFVEVHSNPNLSMKANVDNCLEWASHYEYSTWYLKEHKQIFSGNELALRGRCHILLLPKGYQYPKGLCDVAEAR